MRKIYWIIPLIVLSASIVLASPQVGAPGIGDSLYPDFGNGGYDVQHYTLDLTVSPSSGTYDSPVLINITAEQQQDSISFSVGGINATCSNCSKLAAARIAIAALCVRPWLARLPRLAASKVRCSTVTRASSRRSRSI